MREGFKLRQLLFFDFGNSSRADPRHQVKTLPFLLGETLHAGEGNGESIGYTGLACFAIKGVSNALPQVEGERLHASQDTPGRQLFWRGLYDSLMSSEFSKIPAFPREAATISSRQLYEFVSLLIESTQDSDKIIFESLRGLLTSNDYRGPIIKWFQELLPTLKGATYNGGIITSVVDFSLMIPFTKTGIDLRRIIPDSDNLNILDLIPSWRFLLIISQIKQDEKLKNELIQAQNEDPSQCFKIISVKIEEICNFYGWPNPDEIIESWSSLIDEDQSIIRKYFSFISTDKVNNYKKIIQMRHEKKCNPCRMSQSISDITFSFIEYDDLIIVPNSNTNINDSPAYLFDLFEYALPVWIVEGKKSLLSNNKQFMEWSLLLYAEKIRGDKLKHAIVKNAMEIFYYKFKNKNKNYNGKLKKIIIVDGII